MKRWVIIWFVFLLFVQGFAKSNNSKREIDRYKRDKKAFFKPVEQGPDIGYALMKKGELINCFMNYGQLTDGYLQSQFYNFSWPKSKGAITAGDAAVDDFSFLFARKGNVIDGFTHYREEDWGPVIGHWGHYHAKNQPEDLKVSGYPHLAVSDLPQTWPEGYFDENGNWVDTPGEHHWPGKFRIDINPESPTYGQEIEGEFPADRVVFCVLDDHANSENPPIGIRLTIEAYEYGRPYAADFHFYDVTITNISGEYLDSCWWGYYYDLDYGEYEDEAYYVYSTGLNPGEWDVMYELDPEITDPGEFETGVFGVAFLKTPKDMGITDSHYYLDTGPTTDAELWPIISSNPNDPNIAMRKADFFHGSNVRLDDYTLTQNDFGYDWVCIAATGPFDLAPGESVKSVVVVCGGKDVEDFKKNIDMAISMYQKHYQGPTGPKAPKLYAVPGDGQVTLYWTDEPERTPDPFTGEYDFEGYKIYRSLDDGQTWGKEILDGEGNLVGYIPVATFDVIDEYSGLDPLNSNFNLGSNTGIVHSWVDTDVKNGFVYSYTITAYDHGDPNNNIPALESARGSSENEDNFVKVIPGPKALGFVDPSVEWELISGHGKGYPEIEIIDPFALTDHLYYVTFVDSPATKFNLVDMTTGEVKLSEYQVNTDNIKPVDGFSIKIVADEEFGGIKSVLDEFGRDVGGEDKTDTTGSWYVKVYSSWLRGDFKAKTSDYEIRFTNGVSRVGTRLGRTITIAEEVPFEVWNVTYNQRVTAIVLDDGDNTFNEDEDIYIVDMPYEDWNIGDTYDLDIVNRVPYKIRICNAPEDTLRRPPLEGQLVKLITKRAFVPSDTLQLTFKGYSFEPVSDDDLSQIRVVPNPYVVNAAWERMINVRMLEFMYLPPVCDIIIYTTRGEKVATLHHTDGTGYHQWNITSDSNQTLAYGVYVYVVKTPDGRKHIGKFALIK